MSYIELLSPARDADCGIAAVNCGADAVYIGASKFGARKEAANEIVEIERLIRYAHIYRVKVYLALNTILKDAEIEEAVTIIRRLYSSGIDGLILQDLGLLACNLPPVPLIASTQTDNRTADKVRFLEDCGFARVILARELSLAEIENIRSLTRIELECFVHGALCVSYSGQCWASAAVTGRSANRGECAQICRSAFNLEDATGKLLAKNKHLMSLKDLNLSAHLRQLIDAGIGSFKIEGRLKDINYVKNITSYYRAKIDEILENDATLSKSSSGKCNFSFVPDPQKTFNRGYTNHFITGRQPGLCSFNSQKSLGKQLGKVIGQENDFLRVELSADIHNGDGLCYFDADGQLKGFLVNKVEKGKILPGLTLRISNGTTLYRNLDIQFQKELENKSSERRISCTAEFSEIAEGFCLLLVDEDSNKVQLQLLMNKEPATNAALALNSVKEQLAKSGESVFKVDKISINWSQAYFIPISKINGLRRKALAELLKLREENYHPCRIDRMDKKTSFPESNLSFSANILNHKSEEFYRNHGVVSFEPAYEEKKPEGAQLLMKSRYCIKFELGFCPTKQSYRKDVVLKEPLYLRDSNRRYSLKFNCKSCEMSLYLEEE